MAVLTPGESRTTRRTAQSVYIRSCCSVLLYNIIGFFLLFEVSPESSLLFAMLDTARWILPAENTFAISLYRTSPLRQVPLPM